MDKPEVDNNNAPDRRVFLKGAGVAAAALAMPSIVTSRAAAQTR
jgi:hypothetical protein